jgi:Domain of unknown function (DUF3854)
VITASEWSADATAIYQVLEGKLCRRHAAELAASAISADVAQLREYATISAEQKNRSVLAVLGFAEYQRPTPGLLVPVWDVFGQRAGAQFKPDAPRKDQRGRLIKYESPAGGRVIIDVPPICQPDLNNPSKALWITEGAKKADAAASHGLVCVSIPGVWCWRGTNADGGLTALPDWDAIALNDRRIFLCFDSDATTKPDVMVALRRLANFLSARHVKVAIVHLPATLPQERNDG